MIEESMVKKSMVDFPLWLNAIFTTHDWEVNIEPIYGDSGIAALQVGFSRDVPWSSMDSSIQSSVIYWAVVSCC